MDEKTEGGVTGMREERFLGHLLIDADAHRGEHPRGFCKRQDGERELKLGDDWPMPMKFDPESFLEALAEKIVRTGKEKQGVFHVYEGNRIEPDPATGRPWAMSSFAEMPCDCGYTFKP